MKAMKASLPHPQHESYLRHRRQRTTQIILPVILAALLIAAAAVWIAIAGFRGGGDLSRWGAISAIWIVIPMIFGVLILTVLLAGLVYLMSRLLGILPRYTAQAQELVYRLEGILHRAMDTAVKPVFGVQEVGAFFRALIGRR